jgi:hypothetical protein
MVSETLPAVGTLYIVSRFLLTVNVSVSTVVKSLFRFLVLFSLGISHSFLQTGKTGRGTETHSCGITDMSLQFQKHLDTLCLAVVAYR